jgi:hypothetical protein
MRPAQPQLNTGAGLRPELLGCRTLPAGQKIELEQRMLEQLARSLGGFEGARVAYGEWLEVQKRPSDLAGLAKQVRWESATARASCDVLSALPSESLGFFVFHLQ